MEEKQKLPNYNVNNLPLLQNNNEVDEALEHKENEFVSVLRIFRHGGEITLLVYAGLFIPWANTLLHNPQSTGGEHFFKQGATALYLMGIAFILLAGLHLVKHFVNTPHKVFWTEATKFISHWKKWLRTGSHIIGFLTLSAAFFCIGIACLAMADGLFFSAGENTRSVFKNMSTDTQIQLFIEGIALFGIYATFREILTIYKTTKNGKKKYPNEVIPLDEYKLYLIASGASLWGGIGFILATLILYKGNAELFDSCTNHQMQVFLTIGISLLALYFLLKLPRLLHKYRKAKDNYMNAGIAAKDAVNAVRKAMWKDPVRYGDNWNKGYDPKPNTITTIFRVLSYLTDIAAIVSGCCVLGYLFPTLLNNPDTLSAGSKLFTQGNPLFIIFGAMLICVGVLHMIHRTIDEVFLHYNTEEIGDKNKKIAYAGRNILWHSVLGAGFICVGFACLGGNSMMTSSIQSNLLIAGVALIFTYAIFKGLKHLITPEKTNSVEVVNDNNNDQEQIQYETKWFNGRPYQSFSFGFLLGSASTFIAAAVCYKYNTGFSNQGINIAMAAALLCIGVICGIIHCLMKTPEVFNRHGSNGAGVVETAKNILEVIF